MGWQDIPHTAGIKDSELPVLMQQPEPVLITQNFTALENQEYNHNKATGNAEKNLRIFYKVVYLYKLWLGAHTL